MPPVKPLGSTPPAKLVGSTTTAAASKGTKRPRDEAADEKTTEVASKALKSSDNGKAVVKSGKTLFLERFHKDFHGPVDVVLSLFPGSHTITPFTAAGSASSAHELPHFTIHLGKKHTLKFATDRLPEDTKTHLKGKGLDLSLLRDTVFTIEAIKLQILNGGNTYTIKVLNESFSGTYNVCFGMGPSVKVTQITIPGKDKVILKIESTLKNSDVPLDLSSEPSAKGHFEGFKRILTWEALS